ncbi:MAG: hypothetical protein ACI9VR_003750, partial [Cognaticolwellia sp.]
SKLQERENCSEDFSVASQEAVNQWRFYPLKVEGKRVPSTFVLKLRFVWGFDETG